MVFHIFSIGPQTLAGGVQLDWVCLSTHLSGHFLGIRLLVFSKFCYGVRSPYAIKMCNQIEAFLHQS